MSVWKHYIDSASNLQQRSGLTSGLLYIEYGYCAALLDTDKAAAKPYVKQFREHVETLKTTLPKGHYDMYMSAVLVFELRLHESFHPVKGLSLARDAVKKAPNDPLTLTYCATALFYAPAPFGSKSEALELYLRAEKLFKDPKWYHCWWRPMALMYIAQCYEKQGNIAEALRRTNALLNEYPDYSYLRDTYLPHLNAINK